MKHNYSRTRPLLAALFLLAGLSAHAQQFWRPFRPGLIYTYEVPNATGGGTNVGEGVYTLRLDSAYRTVAGDSAWAFNRVMRETTGRSPGDAYTTHANRFRKSRNNLFGQRLLWQQGSADFTLETITEGSAQVGAALRLRPRVPVASTWVANAALGITATLTSRGLQLVSGQPDTVATSALSTGPSIRLSRRFGLLEGPQWLALSGSPTRWVATQLPVTLAQSAYNPLRLFDLQPGDELGYINDPVTITAYPCPPRTILRRIVARAQTADSLIYTFLEQSSQVITGSPGCNSLPSGTIYTSIYARKWALSLRTGQLGQYSSAPLLAGEYKFASVVTDVGFGAVQPPPGSSPCGGNQLLVYDRVIGPSNGTFGHLTDTYTQTSYSSVLGLGPVADGSVFMKYYRRTRNGVTTTCGSAANYTGLLLATRAQQAAAIATLAPNPVAETATLTLAQPAGSGLALRLTDALGRQVWHAPVAAGQTAVAVTLAGQPAGLYLLHLSGADGTSATWKLVRE